MCKLLVSSFIYELFAATKYAITNKMQIALAKQMFRLPGTKVVFTAATLNWKGVWSATLASDHRGCGFNNDDFKILSSRVLIGGHAAFKIFNAVTSSGPRRRVRVG